MANLNTPFGLQLYQRDGNADFRASAVKYYVPAGTTSALFQGDPVITVASSADSLGYNGVKLAAAGTSNRITGVITGFLGTGTPNPSFFGLSGTPGPAYKPASNSVAYYVLVTEDPAALYEVQANASVAATVVRQECQPRRGDGKYLHRLVRLALGHHVHWHVEHASGEHQGLCGEPAECAWLRECETSGVDQPEHQRQRHDRHLARLK